MCGAECCCTCLRKLLSVFLVFRSLALLSVPVAPRPTRVPKVLPRTHKSVLVPFDPNEALLGDGAEGGGSGGAAGGAGAGAGAGGGAEAAPAPPPPKPWTVDDSLFKKYQRDTPSLLKDAFAKDFSMTKVSWGRQLMIRCLMLTATRLRGGVLNTMGSSAPAQIPNLIKNETELSKTRAVLEQHFPLVKRIFKYGQGCGSCLGFHDTLTLCVARALVLWCAGTMLPRWLRQSTSLLSVGTRSQAWGSTVRCVASVISQSCGELSQVASCTDSGSNGLPAEDA